MAVRPVFSVDVDRAEWDRFQESYNQFRASLKPTADDTKAIGGGFAGVSAQVSNAWRDMARDSRSVAGYIASATRSLIEWGGLIGGLVGIGSLWGLDRLANTAGNLRRSSLGLGSTPGEQRGFAATYGRLTDPEAFLGAVNEALHDVTKRVGLYGAGLGDGDLRGQDTGGVAAELIPALKKIADQTPENMLAQVLRARHLDQFITLEDFERIKHTPAAEIAGYQAEYQRRRRDLELTQQQQKAWQDLQVQLHFAGLSIETTFIRGLTPLAPQLSKLSESFRKLVADLLKSPEIGRWIDEAASGLGNLATTITNPKFEQGVKDFISRVGVLAGELGTLIDSLYQASVWVKNLFGGAGKSVPDPMMDPALPGTLLNPSLPPGVSRNAPNGIPRLGPTFGPQVLPGGATHSSYNAGATVSTGLRAKEAHDFFRYAGWSEEQTAGLLANIQFESGFNPQSVNPSGHQGIAQWDRVRSAQFRAMFGHDPVQGTLEEQLSFVQWELTHTELKAAARLKAARTAGEAGAAVNEGYERSGTNSAGRSGAAQQYMGAFQDRGSARVVISNQTGGNAVVSASQLAAGSV